MEVKNFTNTIKTILIKPASPKIDILWINFHLELKGHLFRKIVINIFAILILIFFTSPMAILNLVGLKYIGNLFNGFELQYIIQTLVVGINNLLLLLIDLGTSWEKPTSKSIY